MNNHTPGPWVGMDENGKFNPDHSWSFNDEAACGSEAAPIFADGRVIAFVVHSSDVYCGYSHPSINANARLIAAAPDMLEALEQLLSIVAIHQRATKNNFAWAEVEFAREVIAKAKGE